MSGIAEPVRTRLLPALLTALGITFLAAGLLNYTTPVAGGVSASDSPTPSPTAVASSSLITLPPLGSADPTATPAPPADRVATRVRIAALQIDLPVVPPGGPTEYPLCGVAMWIGALSQPGEGRATYLYAHARTGMFLPMLTQSTINNGKKMLGMVVEVWTSDDQKFLYEITDVRRHQKDLNDALGAKEEELWLQTSEGPKGTVGKLQVLAMPISQEAAAPADAHPTGRGYVCG